ncbi:hypothetical protein NVP1244A_189 [Vibrio phage 1.244.A._10N.261.54.C3]|nr:hypothetical protein NVP1244A_189 [Vibrio phage 1.244.A._10N.261.54.C3]AUR98817.1 hypothetical protein NVP1255O_189 [Vibrio phage 1.255.O._10N.286.45.F1]
MNYEAIYKRLIQNALDRQRPNVYCEHHHIVPKCEGGGDEDSNMVWLTGREHMVAHILLAKVHRTVGLVYSANMMVNMYGNGRRYQWVREQFSINHPNKSPEFRAMMSELMTGREVSKETCRKLSERDMWWCTGKPSGMSGKSQPQSAKDAISKAMSGENNPFHGHTHSDADKLKMSGVNHRKSKNWVVTSPEGEVFEFVGGLDRFCKEHGLQYDIFKKSNGKGKIKKARAGCNDARIKSEGWEINERN